MHIEKERQTFTLKVRIHYHNHFDHKPKLIFQNFESCSLKYMYQDVVLELTFILPFAFLFFTIHVSRCGIRTYFYFAICIFHKEVPHVCTWLSEMVASSTYKTLQTKHVYQLPVMQQRK